MRIREGMELKHQGWVKKMSADPRGAVILKTVEAIALRLESGEKAAVVFESFLLKNKKLNLIEKTKIALAVSVLCERGDAFRFSWNSYYRGIEYATDMEISGIKELYDPV